MKPTTLVLSLSALALALPGTASAKRLRDPLSSAAPDSAAAAPASPGSTDWATGAWAHGGMSEAEFASADLDAMAAPTAGATSRVALSDGLGGGLSTNLTLPAPDRLKAPEPVQVVAPAPVPPEARREAGGPRFDLVLNNAPAAQVFVQLGQGAGVNVLVPPEVKGNLTINLKAVTLQEALEAIRELYGYDFRISGNRVFVSPNTVQTRIYQVNYLAALREGTSSLKVTSPGRAASNSGSSQSTTGGVTTTVQTSGGSATGSSNDAAKVQMTVQADFWKDLQTSLKELLQTATTPDRSVVINPEIGRAHV